MGTKHKHAEVIKAWADGEVVQFRNKDYSGWTDLTHLYPVWDCDEYRVKPKNTVVTRRIEYNYNFNDTKTFVSSDPNLRLEFSEFGQLVSVEMLK